MPLLLTSPPVAEPLSLAEVKAHLRLPLSDDDAYLTTLITAARRTVESRFGLALLRQGWALFADGWPQDGVFHIPLWPVLSAESLTSFVDDDTPAAIDPAHYLLDAASRPARLALRRGRVFAPPGRRINGLRLFFTAGFGDDGSAVPADLKQGLLATIADWYQNRGDEPGGALPPPALEALAAYRQVRLS